MINRRLVEAIHQLSPQERKRFRVFINSPWFTYGLKVEALLSLYDLILKNGGVLENEALDKKVIFGKFFPEKNFREKEKNALDGLSSDLFRLLKKFLHQVEREKTETEAEVLLSLAKFYRHHFMGERYWQTIKNIRTIHEKETVVSPEVYYARFQTENEVTNMSGSNSSGDDDANILTAIRHLDNFFALQKLELACGLEHQAYYTNVNRSDSLLFIKEIQERVDAGEIGKESIFKIFNMAFRLLKDPEDDKIVAEFDMMLEKHSQKLPFQTLSNFKAFRRFCHVYRYQKHRRIEDLQAIFTLLVEHLKDGYLSLDGKLIAGGLNSLVKAGLRVGRFDEVRAILEEFTPDKICGVATPIEYHNFTFAEFCFRSKNYKEATEKLAVYPFGNIAYSISADLILIKIYYETQDDLLEYRLKSAYHKVRRSNISKEMKHQHFAFLQFVDKIKRYGWDKRSPLRKKLAEKIRKVGKVSDREWLLKQLE